MNAEVVKYSMGVRLWKRCDTEQTGFLTGVLFRPGCVIYLVTWPDGETEHYDFELCGEDDMVKGAGV